MQITANAEMTKMSTEELEKHIDSRYEARAPQAELDALETQYAETVSEDDLNMTEDEPQMSEAYDMGVDLEEWLAREYYEFTNPEGRIGGREDKDYFNPDSFNDFMTLNLKAGIKRKDIMEAAKDVYGYKKNLIDKYRSRNKFSNIPDNLRGILK